MALKFEIIGNNLVVTDTADNSVKLERPAADVYAICETDKFKLVTRTDRNDILLTKDYTGLVDSANTGFSKDTFTNFCRHSLGALKQGGFTFIDPSLVPVLSGPQAARTDITGVVASTSDGDLIGADAKSVIKRGMPAKAYRAYYPLNQSTGQPKDYSGKGNDAFIRPTYETPTFAPYANQAAFPGSGAVGTFYIANDTGNVYYWTGAAYAQDATITRYANKAAFPGTGASAQGYYAADTGLLHRWTGSAYEPISSMAWVNVGSITTKATHQDGFWMLPAALGVLADDDHVVWSGKINMATPGATAFSSLTFGSGTVDGWYADVTTAGKFHIFFNFADNVTRSFGVTNGVFADGTWHTFGIAMDRKTGFVMVFRDGIIDTFGYAIVNNSMQFNPAYRPGIGGTLTNADTGFTGKAAQWKDLHYLTPKQFPLNIAAVMMLMHTTSNYALKESDIVYRTENKTLLLYAVGQSNFTGRGQRPSSVTALGSPQSDAMVGGCAPGGTQGWRSLWPLCNELAGAEGWYQHVYNDGAGGSSLPDGWVGRIRTWAAGQEFVRGSYALSDGGLWKANLSVGSGLLAGIIAANAPTGTPAIGAAVTGADGIPWVYMRAATAGDVPGVVSRNSDLFDPMGYIKNRLGLSFNFDRKIVVTEWGQTDSSPTVNVTMRHYADACKELALYYLEHGIDAVYLGLSIYTSAAGRDANYTGVLQPAIALAISELNDPRVKAGPDARAALGVLSTTAAAGVPGLQTDTYHGTDATYQQWSKLVHNTLKAAGEYQ